MKINLEDGSHLDLEQFVCVEQDTPEDGSITVSMIDGRKLVLTGENRRRVLAVVEEFTVLPKDLTPDDVAHITPVGLTFAEMLARLRSL